MSTAGNPPIRAWSPRSLPGLLRGPAPYLAVVALGLAIRLVLLPYQGTQDLALDVQWGRQVTDMGLAHAYYGNYFPLAWQIFGGAVELSRLLDVSAGTTLKAINTLAEIGSFVLLIALMRTWGLDAKYSLLYWISPYFLVMNWLGFVDGQLSFVLLATLLIVSRRNDPLGYLAAGVPLGAGFLMKPQMIPLVGVVPLLVAAAWWFHPSSRRVNLRPLLLLVAPAAGFVAYSLYFAIAGAKLSTVPHTYLPSESFHYALGISGQGLSPWYVVAQLLRDPGQRLYEVTEPDVLNTIGAIAASALIVGAVTLIARNRPRLEAPELFLALLFTTLIVPVVATRAHEGHLYLASVLSILLAAAIRSRTLNWCLSGLLALEFLNLFARHGLGDEARATTLGGVDDALSKWGVGYTPVDHHVVVETGGAAYIVSEALQAIAAITATVLVAVIAWYAVRAARSSDARLPARAVGSGE
jgi:hypothetical protein